MIAPYTSVFMRVIMSPTSGSTTTSREGTRHHPDSLHDPLRDGNSSATLTDRRMVDTVLIDQETVDAPRQSNDPLLLGLKAVGTSTSWIRYASARWRRAGRRLGAASFGESRGATAARLKSLCRRTPTCRKPSGFGHRSTLKSALLSPIGSED